jgi:hypothetical protein
MLADLLEKFSSSAAAERLRAVAARRIMEDRCGNAPRRAARV